MIDNIKKNQETWDLISKSFDKTRQKPWKQCIDFIKKLKKTDTVIDIGCGNGRHLVICAEHCKKVIGLDLSKELLHIAKEKLEEKKLTNAIFLHSDARFIPLKNESVDAALYIASLHNIHGKENRIQSLKELKRILKKEGTALISVWSKWQDKYRKIFLKKFLLKKEELEFGDIDIYWKQHNLNVPRFY
ncbi:MAG: class I SAM-dependent methyltransferase, partial [Candidatus Thermoplasmatota archaeon]|nr:class I SAM-dependent methyltransferase [Candidatus Thermoplasmatota archaeon]